MLADCDLATSESAAIKTLVALSDERFAQFKNTGKLDDRQITHPILAEIRATTLRRNLETANHRREEIKLAEVNRQQEENKNAEADRQKSERLALAAARAAENANAAKEKATNDAGELIRARLVGDWCWGKYSDGSIKFAQDGTFVETGTLACRGLWRVDRDGTIRLSDDKIVVRIDLNEDKISIAHTTSGYHTEAGAPKVLMGTVCRRSRESAMNPDARDRSVEQQIQALDQQIEALWRAAKGMNPHERRSVERQIQTLRQANYKLKAQAEKAVYAKLDKYEKCIGPDGKVYMRKKPAWVLWREAHPAEAVEEIAKAAAQMRENQKRLDGIQFTTPEPTETQKAMQRQNAEAAANRVHPAN